MIIKSGQLFSTRGEVSGFRNGVSYPESTKMKQALSIFHDRKAGALAGEKGSDLGRRTSESGRLPAVTTVDGFKSSLRSYL